MSDLITSFMQARDRYESARRRWNALPDADARHASGLSGELRDSDNARERAARALIAEASSRHEIRDEARTYLAIGYDGRWLVDGPAVDGSPLFGYDNGPEAQCQHGQELDDECRAVEDAFAVFTTFTALPTGAELAELLVADLREYGVPVVEHLCDEACGDDSHPRDGRVMIEGVSETTSDAGPDGQPPYWHPERHYIEARVDVPLRWGGDRWRLVPDAATGILPEGYGPTSPECLHDTGSAAERECDGLTQLLAERVPLPDALHLIVLLREAVEREQEVTA